MKYVVTYLWKEVDFVEASTPEEAEWLADKIPLDALELTVASGPTAREATPEDMEGVHFVTEEEVS